MLIKSKDTWINCPLIKAKRKIHDCILTNCKYEHGHIISDTGSEVMFFCGEGKQVTLI